ncbi:glucosaminidase domain-containing protein [Sneathiella sp. HT1-7]|uniref:glucosaminidase domain-containing protein n=1 Tax=Sneathiella sp. HT1-7 TaxID=2887192 RepID=UPI001D1390BC|nr:glucosaminidase domain-containing protein [Sneathiella sp. HT1-7]MCC3303765.1 glucosaminidase domain-containing protein [Sneathiella sp. HT1-7]
MQLFRSGIKSNKIVTLAGVVLATAYLVPELIDSAHNVSFSSYGESRALFAKRTPASSQTREQSDQFDMASLDTALSQVDYQLQDIRNGQPVPRFYVEQVPVDIADVTDVDQRKKAFIKIVLPLILSTNEKILDRRERLSTLLQDNTGFDNLRATDRKWLDEMAIRYREETTDLEQLLLKVDEVPVPLALAQAVEESGWGTSRFAREGNALFGQRVWSAGKGIVPDERADDETHEVKAFNSIADSIAAYVHNLNSHAAYAEFREIRARRHTGPKLTYDTAPLVDTLHVYSEKGQEYVDNLRSLIEINQFDDFEDANLAPERLAANRP